MRIPGLDISLRMMQGGTATFDPLTLSPNLWLDGADMSSLFQDSAGTTPVTAAADPVGKWNDKSGAARHVIQATGSARPAFRVTSGKNGVQGDGVDDALAMSAAGAALPNPADIFLVASNPDSDTFGVFLSDATANPYTLVYEDANAASHDQAGSGTLWVNGVAQTEVASGSRNNLHDAMAGGARKVIEVRAHTALATLTQVKIVGYTGAFSSAHYHEMLIYPALTAGQRTTVRDYLTTKWGAA